MCVIHARRRLGLLLIFSVLVIAHTGSGCSSVGPFHTNLSPLCMHVSSALVLRYMVSRPLLFRFNRSGYRESLLQVPQAHFLVVTIQYLTILYRSGGDYR
jgi:hypothetical protein